MNQEVALNPAKMSRCADKAKDPDVFLMSRLNRGDEAAMNELVERFGPGLHRLIGRLVVWSPESDDILQEVFLTAWRKAGTFRGDGPLEGWLRRIAVNRCRNHRRARAAFDRMLQRMVKLRSHTTDNQESLGENGLREAMTHLNIEDRTILVLYYLEELSAKQVADAMTVRVSTLHVRLHRARQRLRERLLEVEARNE